MTGPLHALVVLLLELHWGAQRMAKSLPKWLLHTTELFHGRVPLF